MANNGAQKIRIAQLDGAIAAAVERVGAQKITSTPSRNRGVDDWIPIILGWILRHNG